MTGVLQLLKDEVYKFESTGVIAYNVGVFNCSVGVISKFKLVLLKIGLCCEVVEDAALNILYAIFCIKANELGDDVVLENFGECCCCC